MQPGILRQANSTPPTTKVEDDVVRVGKDVIELITSGMYVSPITVFREYLQNAADAIDGARAAGLLGPDDSGNVTISIDHAARSVTIRDDGIGLAPKEAVPALMAIGGSSKRGSTARGFRGVGRLSGLAYCRELEFRTKAAGANAIVSVTWDCRLLRARLSDGTFGGDLRRIVSEAVSIHYEEAHDPTEHFFEVRMRDVARHRNDMLLNERLIAQYLGQVGPVPFAPDFSAELIEEHLSKHGARVPPVKLTIQGEAVYRPYKDTVAVPGSSAPIRISEIQLLEFANVDGDTGAVGWLGHHEYTRSIPVGLGIRGLRGRVGDVQIGEPDLFEDVYKEGRFNGWTIGEIHVLDRRIVPNARRDNFEVNHHSYNLLAQLGPVTAGIAQRCRSSSVSRNSAQILRNVITEVDARLAEGRPFDAAESSRLRSLVVRAETKLKRVGDEALRETLAADLMRTGAALADSRPVTGASVVALDEALALISKTVTNREQARKLSDLFRQLCS